MCPCTASRKPGAGLGQRAHGICPDMAARYAAKAQKRPGLYGPGEKGQAMVKRRTTWGLQKLL